MLGVRYLRQPLVIYLGVGSDQGDHTGTTPLGLQIQEVSCGIGTIFVAVAGNETGMHHLYLGVLKPNESYEDVEIRVAEDESGFCIELWGNSPELFTVGFISPCGEVVNQIPNISQTHNIIPFVLCNSTITVYYVCAHFENRSGKVISIRDGLCGVVG